MHNLIRKLNTTIAVIVVFALVIIIVDFAWYRNQAEPVPETTVPITEIKKAVFLGDSYTEGQGASSSDRSYVRYAAPVAGLRPAVRAAQGATGILADGGGGDRQKFDDRLATTVFPENPNVVVIAGGINDQRQVRSGGISEYRAEYDKLIADIKTGLPEAQIVVLGPFCPESPD